MKQEFNLELEKQADAHQDMMLALDVKWEKREDANNHEWEKKAEKMVEKALVAEKEDAAQKAQAEKERQDAAKKAQAEKYRQDAAKKA